MRWLPEAMHFCPALQPCTAILHCDFEQWLCSVAVHRRMPTLTPRLPALREVQVILLSDWYQPSSKELVEGTLGYPFSGWPPPDTIHINGRTRVSCQTMAEFAVEPRKWYYLRVTNGAL